jgi:hypothetical protein
MIKLIRLELYKLKNSPPLWICLGIMLMVFLWASYAFYLNFQEPYYRTVGESKDANPWHFFIENQGSRLGFCISTMVLIWVTWFSYIDYKNKLWFKNLTLPIPFIQILIAKMIIVCAFVIIVQTLLFLFSLFVLKPQISNYYTYIFTEKYKEFWLDYLQWFGFYLVTLPKLIIFQFWLTLKLRKSYLTAFFIGFVGVILNFLTFSPYYFYFFYLGIEWTTIFFQIILSIVFFYFIIKEIKSFYL